MFHLPAIPFSEIEQYLIGIAIVCGTGLSVYEYLKHKFQKVRKVGASRPRKRRRTCSNRRARDVASDSPSGTTGFKDDFSAHRE